MTYCIFFENRSGKVATFNQLSSKQFGWRCWRKGTDTSGRHGRVFRHHSICSSWRTLIAKSLRKELYINKLLQRSKKKIYNKSTTRNTIHLTWLTHLLRFLCVCVCVCVLETIFLLSCTLAKSNCTCLIITIQLLSLYDIYTPFSLFSCRRKYTYIHI